MQKNHLTKSNTPSKALNKIEKEGVLINLIDAICEKHIVNLILILSCERINAFPIRSRIRTECLLLSFLLKLN